jgi:uncharacterized protein YkwD
MPRFSCPNCKASLGADDERIGKGVRCPVCGAGLRVPSPADVEPVPAPRTPARRSEPRRNEDPSDWNPPPQGGQKKIALLLLSLLVPGILFATLAIILLIRLTPNSDANPPAHASKPSSEQIAFQPLPTGTPPAATTPARPEKPAAAPAPARSSSRPSRPQEPDEDEPAAPPAVGGRPYGPNRGGGAGVPAPQGSGQYGPNATTPAVPASGGSRAYGPNGPNAAPGKPPALGGQPYGPNAAGSPYVPNAANGPAPGVAPAGAKPDRPVATPLPGQGGPFPNARPAGQPAPAYGPNGGGQTQPGAQGQAQPGGQGQAAAPAANQALTEQDLTKLNEARQAVLKRVNAYREQAGLKPVKFSDELSLGCQAHARYLILNDTFISTQKLNPHDELGTLPGFSTLGQVAARGSVICSHLGKEPTDGPAWSVEVWMASFFHRVPILSPGLKVIGFGYARQGQLLKMVMDVQNGERRKSSGKPPVIVYPADGQDKVPRVFGKGITEFPNPIPENKPGGTAGFPITVQFPASVRVTGVTGEVSAKPAKKTADAGATEVPVWMSTPSAPAINKALQKHTVCLIPKAPLAPNLTYTVTVSAKVDGKAWTKTWSFTTGDE